MLLSLKLVFFILTYNLSNFSFIGLVTAMTSARGNQNGTFLAIVLPLRLSILCLAMSITLYLMEFWIQKIRIKQFKIC